MNACAARNIILWHVVGASLKCMLRIQYETTMVAPTHRTVCVCVYSVIVIVIVTHVVYVCVYSA